MVVARIEPSSERAPRRGVRPHAGAVAVALLALVAVSLVPGTPPAARAQDLQLTAPYPAVAVQPGATATFDLSVTAAEPIRVDLAVEGVPDGWTTVLRGGGREVGSVTADPDEPPELVLDVDVPDDAEPGTTTITVVGRAGAETQRLALDVTVLGAEGGEVTLTTEVPARRATAEDTFEYSLELSNDTPQQLTFELQAVGPRGWTVSIEPSGEADATSVTVDARGSQTLTVQATPPAQASEGVYQLRAEAVAGEQRVAIDLAAEITGRVALEFATADERLNATGTAGNPTSVDVVVDNVGTAPLTGLSFSGNGPSEWEVTFEPTSVQALAAGERATATATIVPSTNAVAGDYVVTLRVSGEGIDESLQVRVTVETPPLWGIVGIGLILLTLGAMAWVFRRYGRR